MAHSLGLDALLSGKINRVLFANKWGTNGVSESDLLPWNTSNIEILIFNVGLLKS